ncbi:unnamed protein product [Prorocentrum cordatum]|uniref:Uncharacterized protein n=1 Tax=Prorocentrum cordatum TaxID=2364126 RepID=A0ABN9X7E4_9DINO|nr:unnamed protein product [Polarella glacialis]
MAASSFPALGALLALGGLPLSLPSAASLLNLALPPAPLDENEVAQRVKKYGQVMRSYVLSQPVDPVHLRASGLDSDPAPLCPGNADQLAALKQPASVADAQLLAGLLDGLQPVLKPEQPIASPEDLIAPFPEIPSTSQPAAA